MRVLGFICSLAVLFAIPARADEPAAAAPAAVEAAAAPSTASLPAAPSSSSRQPRPADALDSVVLVSGELVRCVVLSEDSNAVTVRMRSGEEKIIPWAEVRTINKWSALAPTQATSPATRTVSYAGQTLASDGAAILLTGGGLLVSGKWGNTSAGNAGAEALLIVGLTTYALGAPIIHKFHHEGWGSSLKSLGLRVGLPVGLGLIGVAIGYAGDSRSNDEYGWAAAVLGFGGAILGGVAAVTLDAVLLAHEEVPVEAPRVSLAPLLLPRGTPIAPQGGEGVAFAARF
jgi:hypothetical protein